MKALPKQWQNNGGACNMLRDNCLECMECCKVLIFHTRNRPGALNMEFFHARGCRVLTEADFLTVELDHPCPHLTAKGCDIYENRPETCRRYDCSVHTKPFSMR